METWKDIKGFEGLYQVSNLGRVKGLSRHIVGYNGASWNLPERILSLTKDNAGYPNVKLYVDGVRSVKTIHRLVALAFIPNPEQKPCINHKNGIKTDYSIDNLEWVTHKENSRHAFDTGLAKGKSRPGKLNPMFGKSRGANPRAKITIDTSTGVFYDCAKDAADAIGMKYGTLINMLKGHNPNRTSLRYA